VVEANLRAGALTDAGRVERIAQMVGTLLQNAGQVHPGRRAGQGQHRGCPVEDSRPSCGSSTAELASRRRCSAGVPALHAGRRIPGSQPGCLGLGLALVKGLVEMHGGEVHAHSDGLGQGAEFVIELPLDQSAGKERAQAQPGPRHAADGCWSLRNNPGRGRQSARGTRIRRACHRVAYNGPADGLHRARTFNPEIVLAISPARHGRLRGRARLPS